MLLEIILYDGATVTSRNNTWEMHVHTVAWGHGHLEALLLIIKNHGEYKQTEKNNRESSTLSNEE